MPTTTVQIPGIHCASCAALIKDVSSEFPAVKSVNVNLVSKKVTIDHGEDFDVQKWTTEIEELGEAYKVHTSSLNS